MIEINVKRLKSILKRLKFNSLKKTEDTQSAFLHALKLVVRYFSFIHTSVFELTNSIHLIFTCKYLSPISKHLASYRDRHRHNL